MQNIETVIEKLKGLSIDTPIKAKLPDDLLIDEYEKKLGLKFPVDYRKFLKEASHVFVGTLSPLTVSENYNVYGEVYYSFIELNNLGFRDLLPICEDNGDYYCLAEDASVVFISHDGYIDESWPDLATWIEKVWIEGV
jgi:hypothetical protein